MDRIKFVKNTKVPSFTRVENPEAIPEFTSKRKASVHSSGEHAFTRQKTEPLPDFLKVNADGDPYVKALGRRRLYIPTLLTDAQRKRAQHIVDERGAFTRAKRVNSAEYIAFCSANRLSQAEGWPYYLAQLEESKLKESSVVVRLETARAGVQLRGATDSAYAAALRYANDSLATNPAGHARDANVSTLTRIMEHIDEDFLAPGALALIFGFRPIDSIFADMSFLEYERRFQTLDGAGVAKGVGIECRRGKTKHGQRDRRMHFLGDRYLPPFRFDPGYGVAHFRQLLEECVMATAQAYRRRNWKVSHQYALPCADVDVKKCREAATDSFNRAIREASIIAGVASDDDDQPFTSYSFRRNFIHRTIILCTAENGEVDFTRVIELTGHHATDAVKSTYATMSSDFTDMATTSGAYDPFA